MNMDIIRINGKRMTFHPEAPLEVKPDGSFVLRVKKRKEKKNIWGELKVFYVTGTYLVPAKRMTNIEFDGVSYTCKNMPMNEVVKLRAHIETMLTLDNLK